MAENFVESSLAFSGVEAWDKIRNRVGSAVTDEVINPLHLENFNLTVFKKMIKKSGMKVLFILIKLQFGDCFYIEERNS